jgi:SAM-dependent methyltransferase
VGLEPSPRLAEICREKGIEIIEKPFEEVDIDIQADVVASFEVIEHLFRPSDFVEWIYRALRPGGIAILTCPNIEGFDTLLLGREAVAVDHQHLNYFNPDSLDVLLRRTGFGSVEISTPGMMDVDLVRRGLKNGEVTEQKLGPILNRLLAAESDSLDRQIQALLQEARLSSNMMAVAVK